MNKPWGEYESDGKTPLEQLVRHMIAVSGKSGSQVSREIGRVSNYIWAMLRNKSTPRVDLLVSIAEACGYSIVVRGHGEEYLLGHDSDGLQVLQKVDPASLNFDSID